MPEWELIPKRYRERIVPATAVYCGIQYNYVTGGTSGSPSPKWRMPQDVSPSYRNEVRRCWDYINPGPPYLTGKSFDLYAAVNPFFEVYPASKRIEYVDANTGKRVYYDGGFVPTSMGPDSPNNSDILNLGNSGTYSGSFGDASSYGAKGWNQARPKIEQADAAVFTGESREVPDMFRGTAQRFRDTWKAMGGSSTYDGAMAPKRVADEFLNLQFGWLPFVRDLGKFYDTFVNTDKYIAQIQRDNGQFVKRHRIIEDQITTTHQSETNLPAIFPSLTGLLLKNRVVNGVSTHGKSYYITVKQNRVWFEGSFKYYLPYFDMKNQQQYLSKINDLRRKLALYGARISPSTVWNLTPWSWAVDWVSSVGDSISNLTAAAYDGLAAKYAFVMRETAEVRKHDCTLFAVNGDQYFTWSQEITTKRRAKASPFGFGLQWENFTPRQIAIAGALGISRSS